MGASKCDLAATKTKLGDKNKVNRVKNRVRRFKNRVRRFRRFDIFWRVGRRAGRVRARHLADSMVIIKMLILRITLKVQL